jgi:hypothetical protein
LIFCVLLYRSFLYSRSVSVRVLIYLSIYLSIYQSFYLKQQITTTIFFRRRSRHRPRHCRRSITSIRRCTLEWCSMITVQDCWSSSYFPPLFFLLLCALTDARLFPLSHPWLMSLVYRAKSKRHCCNRVKLVFVSFSLSQSFFYFFF